MAALCGIVVVAVQAVLELLKAPTGVRVGAAVLVAAVAATSEVDKLYTRRREQQDAEQRAHSDPVDISAHRYRDFDQGMTFAFPSNLGGTAVPEITANENRDVEAFARTHGAVDVGFTHVAIVLRGKSEKAIVSGIRAQVLEKAPPITGTLMWATPEGEADVINLGLDLDDPKAVARCVSDTYGGIFHIVLEEPYFTRKTVTLDPGEVQRLSLVAETASYAYLWKLEFDVETASRKETITVGDGPTSEPFHTTALAPSIYAANSRLYQAIYYLCPPDAGWKDPRSFCASGNSLCRPTDEEPVDIKPY